MSESPPDNSQSSSDPLPVNTASAEHQPGVIKVVVIVLLVALEALGICLAVDGKLTTFQVTFWSILVAIPTLYFAFRDPQWMMRLWNAWRGR